MDEDKKNIRETDIIALQATMKTFDAFPDSDEVPGVTLGQVRTVLEEMEQTKQDLKTATDTLCAIEAIGDDGSGNWIGSNNLRPQDITCMWGKAKSALIALHAKKYERTSK